MRKEQEEAFWLTIKAFKEIGLLPYQSKIVKQVCKENQIIFPLD